jgi:hypothetical protein
LKVSYLVHKFVQDTFGLRDKVFVKGRKNNSISTMEIPEWLKNFTDEELAELQRLYEEEFKEPLSLEEAREMAERLMLLCHILVQPLPSEIEAAKKKRDEAA